MADVFLLGDAGAVELRLGAQPARLPTGTTRLTCARGGLASALLIIGTLAVCWVRPLGHARSPGQREGGGCLWARLQLGCA